MALQNVRSLLWRGEDLGAGGGNTRELITATQAVGVTRPTIISRAFTASLDITSLIAVTSPYQTAGRNRIIINRSARFWLTLTGTLGQGGSNTLSVNFPIAPLQAFFLPVNLQSAVLTGNSTWPIPQPLTGAPTAAVPIVTSAQVLTIDLVLEG